MLKHILLTLLWLALPLAACAAQTPAQTPTFVCDSTTASGAPPILAFRLGMTPAQVKAVFGKSLKLKIKREGTFFQNFIDKPPPAFLPGVRALYLRFFDTKLFQIEVFFDETDKRQTARRYVETLASEYGFPPAELWENRFERYKITCGGFSATADKTLNPHVELTDEAARARFDEAQKKLKRKD